MTPEQRYNQAIAKARILTNRSVRNLTKGVDDNVPCMMDLQRRFLIDAIAKAYSDGKAAQ